MEPKHQSQLQTDLHKVKKWMVHQQLFRADREITLYLFDSYSVYSNFKMKRNNHA